MWRGYCAPRSSSTSRTLLPLIARCAGSVRAWASVARRPPWVSHRFSEPALLGTELWQLNGIVPQMLWLDLHSV